MPEYRFEKRPPGHGGIDKNIVPKWSWPGTDGDRGHLPSPKCVGQIAKKDAVGRLLVKEQLEARPGLELNIHFRNTRTPSLCRARVRREEIWPNYSSHQKRTQPAFRGGRLRLGSRRLGSLQSEPAGEAGVHLTTRRQELRPFVAKEVHRSRTEGKLRVRRYHPNAN